MEKILVLVFALFISFNANSKEKNLIDKLYYTGFSFSGYYKDKAYASKYFSELGDKKIVNLFFEIANNLEPVHFKIIADQKSNK